MLKQLINLFIKKNGRSPNALEMLQLKFKAAQQSGKGKVIEFPRDKITDWKTPRPTTKGEVIDASFAPGKDAKGKMVFMSDKDFKDLHRSFRLNLAKNSREFNEEIADRIIKREMYENVNDSQRKLLLNDLDQVLKEPLAGGGIAGMLGERTGYKDAKKVKGRDEKIFYPPYETNDPEEAIKEIIKRLINVEPAKVPLTDKLQLMFDLNRIKAGGSTDLFGGELNFGYNKNFGREGEGIGFEWKKQFADGGIAGMLGEPTYQDEDHRVPYSGGKFVLESLPAAIRKIIEKFGKKSITTADKIKRPFKAIEAEDTKAAFDRFNNKVATQEALAKGSEKMAGPVKHTKTGPFDFLESSDATTWLKQEKFFDPKALDIYGNKVPANWIAKEKKDAQKLIDDLGPLNVSPNHPNYKDMKAIRQSAKDRLESIKVTEALGGNIKMHDWLRMNRKNIKMSDYIRKADAPVVKDELSGIKKAFVQEKSSPWFKDPKILTPEDELRKEFPGISDDLIKNILADDNPQRIAEVKATLHEAMKMQEKGMPVEEILNVFKKQGKKPTKHASGGLAGMLGEWEI